MTPLEQAERAAEKGDWRSAAVHYETAGEPNQALDCYDKAGEFLKAALAYERQILGSGVDYRLCLAKKPSERFQSAGEIVSFAVAAKLI